jgi:hypothetical protein
MSYENLVLANEAKQSRSAAQLPACFATFLLAMTSA